MRRKLKTLTKRNTQHPADDLFRKLNPIVRGWAQYFRHSAASRTYADIRHYLWWRLWRWLLHKHPRTSKGIIATRYNMRRVPTYNGVQLYNPTRMRIQRYHYRGSKIATSWEITNAVPA